MEPFMIYTGNHLFHYTKFESALKIIATESLKFGNFKDMNDIAEVKRDVYGMIPREIIEEQLLEYKSISLSLDDDLYRGFSIDPLWGHYAQGGNGVCLVFAKDKLEKKLKEQFGLKATIAPIKYLSNFSNAIFTEGDTPQAVKKHIENNIDDIFFTKSLDWKYEKELRILIKEDGSKSCFFYGKDTLIAAILCLPKVEDYKESPEFKVLKSILPNKPILRYTTSLGNKELLNEDGKKVCGILGLDIQPCFE